MLLIQPHRSYRCPMLVNGVPCGRVFNRAWNLRRHSREKHGQSRPCVASTFVLQATPPAADLDAPPLQPRRALQPASTDAAEGEMSPGQLQLPPLIHDGGPTTVHAPTALPPLSALLPGREPTVHTKSRLPDGLLGSEQWLGRGRFRDIMPSYDVIASKKYPRQLRGIQWLSESGKDHMGTYVTRLMASWGVSATHSGTCVVWPKDWQALEPETLAGLLTFENCPLIDSDRAMYKYDDHITSLARAMAWFRDWPRTGIQFDNFLEAGPYQRNDGSHRCHNPLCVNPGHIVYEPAWYNICRQECQKRALFLRTQGQHVPPECGLHSPPCLMQHASLTMFEACSIQMSVFRESYGFPQAPPGRRPPWHRYPTFEDRLPLRFAPSSAAVRVRCGDRTTLAAMGDSDPRHPALVCQLCNRIKSFTRVANLWSHIRNKHADRSDEDKAREVRRTASVWESYMKTRRSNPTDPTMIKLAQIARDTFTWDVVERWSV